MVVSDVVIQILSRLPPESLFRFKSVCKSWYSLINDPKFVTEHLSYSLPYKHVLLTRLVTNSSGQVEFLLSILEFSSDRSVSVLDAHFPFPEDFPELTFRGHSHGLVCLSDLTSIFLSNPMTRQFRKLPPSILLHDRHLNDYHGHNTRPTAVEFGYDAKSKNFKVVRIVDIWHGIYPDGFRVQIYDLSKDRWREIETPLMADVCEAPMSEMYHEGKFYWWALHELFTIKTEIILTFDLSEEIFCQISVPESFNRLDENLRSLGVLNGSVILFHYPEGSNEKNFDIWEMEKHDSGDVSWSKLLTIGPVFGIEYPLVFVSSDELLMESEQGQVILFNSKTQRFKELPIKGEKRCCIFNRFEATFFIKSLVSVEGRNNISYDF